MLVSSIKFYAIIGFSGFTALKQLMEWTKYFVFFLLIFHTFICHFDSTIVAKATRIYMQTAILIKLIIIFT